jgi:choline-glycine betaine transporter
MSMQQQPGRAVSGARAIALDQRVTFARYRLFQFLALLFTAALSLGLHLFFGR